MLSIWQRLSLVLDHDPISFVVPIMVSEIAVAEMERTSKPCVTEGIIQDLDCTQGDDKQLIFQDSSTWVSSVHSCFQSQVIHL